MGSVIYRPRAFQAALLDVAWSYVSILPYQVLARWLFYRLLQDGHVKDKRAYKPFLYLTSATRKRFYKAWRPWTLSNDTRPVVSRGIGFVDTDGWLQSIAEHQVSCYTDRWMGQPARVVVCYEAAAMTGQFNFYLPSFVPRVAFRGDSSIPAKWDVAKLALPVQD
jgi:hypothetical protein